MRLLSRFEKYLVEKVANSPHELIFVNEFHNNQHLLSSQRTNSDGVWVREEYIFIKNVALYFEIKSNKGITKSYYFNVEKLVLLKYLNIFTECRVYLDLPKGRDEVQFYILDDVASLNFRILDLNSEKWGI